MECDDWSMSDREILKAKLERCIAWVNSKRHALLVFVLGVLLLMEPVGTSHTHVETPQPDINVSSLLSASGNFTNSSTGTFSLGGYFPANHMHNEGYHPSKIGDQIVRVDSSAASNNNTGIAAVLKWFHQKNKSDDTIS